MIPGAGKVLDPHSARAAALARELLRPLPLEWLSPLPAFRGLDPNRLLDTALDRLFRGAAPAEGSAPGAAPESTASVPDPIRTRSAAATPPVPAFPASPVFPAGPPRQSARGRPSLGNLHVSPSARRLPASLREPEISAVPGPADATTASQPFEARGSAIPREYPPAREERNPFPDAGRLPRAPSVSASGHDFADPRNGSAPTEPLALPESPTAARPSPFPDLDGRLAHPPRQPSPAFAVPRSAAAPASRFTEPLGTDPKPPPMDEGSPRMRLVSNRADLAALLQAEVSSGNAGAGQAENLLDQAGPLSRSGFPAPSTAAADTPPRFDAPGPFHPRSGSEAEPFSAASWAEEALVDRVLEKLEDRMRDESLRQFGLTGGSF